MCRVRQNCFLSIILFIKTTEQLRETTERCTQGILRLQHSDFWDTEECYQSVIITSAIQLLTKNQKESIQHANF